MSYTPKIVVDYNDLEKLFKGMPELLNNTDEISKFVIEAFQDKYAGASELKGIKIMILHPDLSFFNQEVRNWFYEYDIQYVEIN